MTKTFNISITYSADNADEAYSLSDHFIPALNDNFTDWSMFVNEQQDD